MADNEKPAEKPTTKMEAVPEWAIALTNKVQEGFRQTNTNIDLLTGDLQTVKAEVRILTAWKIAVESNPTTPPPITSERVKAVIESHPSQMDLETAAKLGQALAELSEERAKREKLEKESATKEDVKKLLDDAAKVQTAAIVSEVMKTPTAQKLKSAVVPVLLLVLTLVGLKLQAAVSRLQGPPTTQSNVVQVSPVTVYADAGAE